jgi:predicted DsbA family dithiol-disulfide isomerase
MALQGVGGLLPLRVDVWSDLVCPWCHIGLHRLRRLARQDGLDVEIVHHAFQLDPARTRSEPTRAYLAARYGGDVDGLMRNADRAASAEGLHLHQDRSVACNTRDGHRVVALGLRHGLQDAVVERLMRAHFEEGADLADRTTLARLAGEAGLDAGQAAAMLESEGFEEDVNADLDQARALGIHGVPFFLFDGRFAFSGAQPDAAFREAFRLAAAPAPA